MGKRAQVWEVEGQEEVMGLGEKRAEQRNRKKNGNCKASSGNFFLKVEFTFFPWGRN